MTTFIDIAEVSPALVDDLANNGGEITLTRDGKPVAKLVRVEGTASDAARSNERVSSKGEWMSAIAAADKLGTGPYRDTSIRRKVAALKVFFRYMEEKGIFHESPARKLRERATEHLHGSVKVLGDILSPIDESDGPMAGTILYQGDIVSPLDEEWEADK
ncbi:MAG TPA: hypothetical protein VGQ21_03995 [Thermoanaerobaculia bacterium]|jgi:antitoxin (DNA-binding transcriptional repressor) of toxin-antitoxin stability system|nr:hypothetical protein [Thermoanaerobaculia bacterium]